MDIYKDGWMVEIIIKIFKKKIFFPQIFAYFISEIFWVIILCKREHKTTKKIAATRKKFDHEENMP
jgi:hypothetical protein